MTRERERAALRYAAHLALRAVKRDGVFTLGERYGEKEKIGTYRSVEALERAISRQHDRMLAAVEREIDRLEAMLTSKAPDSSPFESGGRG
jgi:hypothetical protein